MTSSVLFWMLSRGLEVSALREVLAGAIALSIAEVRDATRVDLAATVAAHRATEMHDCVLLDQTSAAWRAAANGAPELIGNFTSKGPKDEAALLFELDVLRAHPPWARQYEMFPNRAALGPLEPAYLAHGHHPRLAAIPFRFAVYGREMAFVSYDFDDVAHGAYVVRSQPMVEDLRALFTRLWAESYPLVIGQPGSDALDIVRMLSAGLTDESAAGRIGVSVRTYRRRIQQLMSVFRVSSRFAAGVEAGRRGLVDLATAVTPVHVPMPAHGVGPAGVGSPSFRRAEALSF